MSMDLTKQAKNLSIPELKLPQSFTPVATRRYGSRAWLKII